MKKLITLVAFIMVLMTAVLAFGENWIHEDIIHEAVINEIVINEIQLTDNENLGKEEEYTPNYVISIGDHGIEFHTDHHFGWITAIGDGFNTAKDWCCTAANDVATTVTTTAESAVSTVKGWFGI